MICPSCGFEQDSSHKYCCDCGCLIDDLVQIYDNKPNVSSDLFVKRFVELDHIPNSLNNYGGYTISKLNNYDIEKLNAYNITTAFYWYATAPYEGSGAMIALKDDGWYVFNLSHCSCYGPTEHINFNGNAVSKSLTGLKKKSTEEFYKEIKELVDLARIFGYR
ncbi:MAG: hypothetical protein PHF86_11835 [Candidatus Nanoarchaeia archaeon]|nr:hypothetical protein [Candidatus Nanoarchaeia archaeon]